MPAELDVKAMFDNYMLSLEELTENVFLTTSIRESRRDEYHLRKARCYGM